MFSLLVQLCCLALYLWVLHFVAFDSTDDIVYFTGLDGIIFSTGNHVLHVLMDILGPLFLLTLNDPPPSSTLERSVDHIAARTGKLSSSYY